MCVIVYNVNEKEKTEKIVKKKIKFKSFSEKITKTENFIFHDCKVHLKYVFPFNFVNMMRDCGTNVPTAPHKNIYKNHIL